MARHTPSLDTGRAVSRTCLLVTRAMQLIAAGMPVAQALDTAVNEVPAAPAARKTARMILAAQVAREVREFERIEEGDQIPS